MAMSGMRSFAKSKWAIGLFALLVISFGVFGFSDPFSGVVGGGFIRAGDRSIGARDVNREVNQQIERIRQETNEVISMRQAAERGIVNQVLNQLGQQTIALAYADEIGVRASTKAVTDLLVTAPRFKDALGRVNMQAVAQYAGEQNMSVNQFENSIRDEITFSYIQQAVFAGLTTPKVLTEPMAAFIGERRTFGVARLGPTTLPAPKQPTDAELAAFYEERKATFAVPELRRISVIQYSSKDFTDKVQVTDTQIKNAYDRRIREFSTPETREIKQVASTDRQAVQTVIDTVKQGVPVEQAVTRVQGASLATLTVKPADLTNKEYSDAVFAVPANEAFGPLQVGDNWNGFIVTTITPGVATPLEQVSGQLRSELAQGEAKRLFDNSAETFSDLVGGGATLEDISVEIGAPVIMLDGVTRSGAHPVYGPVALLQPHAEALAHMFEAKAGETSEVIEGDDLRAVMRLDAVIPTRTRPLEEVREQVVAMFMSDQVQKAARAIADGVVAKVKAGASLEQAAREAKMISARVTVGRVELQNDSAGQVFEGAFRLADKEAGVIATPEGEPWVVHVEEVVPYDVKADTGGLSNRVTSLVRDSVGNDLSEVMTRGLQKQVKVNTNNKAIEDYLASFTAEDAQ